MRKKLRLGLLGLASVISLAACADVTRANQPSTNTNKDSNNQQPINYQTIFTARLSQMVNTK